MTKAEQRRRYRKRYPEKVREEKIKYHSSQLSKILFRDKLPNYCENCNSTEDLHMHHKVYRYPPKIEDLIVLCRRCHTEEHQKITNRETPVFPMETKNIRNKKQNRPTFPLEQDETFRRHVEKLTTPIFNKFLKEVNSNSMTTNNSFIYAWRPHNYRLKIPFNRKYLREIVLRRQLSRVKNLTYAEHSKIWSFKKFVSGKNYSITIQIGKDNIIPIYSSKKWYSLESNVISEISNMIKKRVEEIEFNCIEAVEEFIDKFGGRAYFKEREWVRHEDHIHGDAFLDNLPKKLIIHDTVFKKVYDKGLEFKSPEYVKNYINNRAIENISPEIAKEINKSNTKIVDALDKWDKAVVRNIQAIKKNTEVVNLEIYNKKLHMKVLKSMDNTMKLIKDSILQTKYKGRRLSRLERICIK